MGDDQGVERDEQEDPEQRQAPQFARDVARVPGHSSHPRPIAQRAYTPMSFASRR